MYLTRRKTGELCVPCREEADGPSPAPTGSKEKKEGSGRFVCVFSHPAAPSLRNKMIRSCETAITRVETQIEENGWETLYRIRD